MDQGPARAGFLVPGRITLGTHFGRVDGDPQSARGPLLKPTPKVHIARSSLLYRKRSAGADALYIG